MTDRARFPALDDPEDWNLRVERPSTAPRTMACAEMMAMFLSIHPAVSRVSRAQ